MNPAAPVTRHVFGKILWPFLKALHPNGIQSQGTLPEGIPATQARKVIKLNEHTLSII